LQGGEIGSSREKSVGIAITHIYMSHYLISKLFIASSLQNVAQQLRL